MDKKLAVCEECESDYFAKTSEMMSMCPDCSHYLYNYPNCVHEFENGRCIHCYWNGNTSEYLRKIKDQ
ncbi:MAG: hypothetical protein ACO1N0_15620 [Fluviicola sp.]